MTTAAVKSWEIKRTDETKKVEDVLKEAGYEKVDAYRYNSASIRVRVIDQRFRGKSVEERDTMVEPHLETLPERTQADIMSLLTLTPEEIGSLLNAEFEDPSPSML